MAAFISVFCCGAFFGAALYITLAQHPAALEVGPSFAVRFFAPVYRRAAAMQAALAVLGTLAGLWAWWQGGSGLLGLLGTLLLFSVVPFTLVLMMPVNNRLLAPGRDPEAPDTEALLRRWGSLHAVRTALSGLAFLLLLGSLAFR
jgi:uncharacterized membrane protein